ncbi:MAG: type II secretion system F family protein [Sphingomonadales bacterium]|nr:type II secretion system F family protein [Sphingomonadales bacterium]MDE2568025.1 type II secretion system F family protein [Sphingomonadales bacterium]
MSGLLIRLVILIAIFVSVLIFSQVVVAAFLNSRAQRHAINKRLQLLRSGIGRDSVMAILRRNVPARLAGNAGPIEKLFFHLRQLVANSGMGLNSTAIIALMGMAFLVLASFLLVLAMSSRFQVTIGIVELILGVSAAAAFGIPLMLLGRLAQKRRKRMEEQFPVALDVFSRALRAGHPISAAIELLTQEVEDPLGSEFGLVSDEVAYGAELNDALLGLAERWDLEDVRMFVISLAVQSETGGNLAEILENLTKVIRERAALYMKVRALSSEGRMSGWLLTILPVLGFVSMFLVAPQFYFDVAEDPMFFWGFTGLIVMYLIGVLMIRKIIDIKV